MLTVYDEPMNATTLFERLLAAGIVHESDGGQTVCIDSQFSRSVEKNLNQLRTIDHLEAWIEAKVNSLATADALFKAKDEAPELVASYLALRPRLVDTSSEDVMRLAVTLSQLRTETAPTDGAPVSFLPVRGNQLPSLLTLQSPAVVYCWREACEPCDEMKDALESVFPQPPEDISLLSVYGPGSARLLQEEYDVQGAPTTLFIVNGRVDSRLHGAHYPETIQREVDKIRSSRSGDD